MADVTITGLPNASTLTGSERVPMDQSGTTVDAAASAIAALATKATVGLSNVDNTSDANKPVSTAQQAALDAKAAAGAIGSSGLTMTAGVLGRESGTGAPVMLSLSGLSIVNGVLTVTGGSNQAQTVNVAVRNNTGSAIAKGVPVYVTGSSGTTITIAPADASTEATAAETLGLTTASIANNTDGTVIAVGLLDGLNTSALTEGQIVWLSETTGALTTTRPTQPAHGVVCGYCVKQGSGTSGILYVKVDNGLELSELHDVLVTGATAGQFLQLAADGLWKPRTFVATDISNSTTVGRALVTAASTAAQRSALELGTAAQAATGDFAPTTFTPGTITYGATVDLDMAALAGGYRTISLTGALTFTTSNRASGRTVTLRLICDATGRALTFPAGWVFVGTKPSTIAASKTAVLSITFFGTADSDCVAAYGVQT